ncbi:hypothetical protein QQ045_032264 [Rhodiola kirilowii]
MRDEADWVWAKQDVVLLCQVAVFGARAPEVAVRVFLNKRTIDGQVMSTPKLMDESCEEDEDEHSETFCGSCGGNYNADEFWIGCDICERWYHGKCVKITPAKAESIKQYKCPSCIKRNRQ